MYNKKTILSVGKFVEILEPSCFIDDNVKLYSLSEKNLVVFQKYIEIPHDPENPVQA